MKNENNRQCDPCEQTFENNVEKIVDEVEGYTSADRKERRKEVDDAFGTRTQEKVPAGRHEHGTKSEGAYARKTKTETR